MKVRKYDGTSWSEIDWDAHSPGLTLVPGLVDTHVHGIMGLDVMEGASHEIGVKLREIGVEWFCPTTVSSLWEQIERIVVEASHAFGSIGVHLEGPMLNPDRCGAQPREHIYPIRFEQVEPILKDIRIITLAPEVEGASRLCEALTKKQVRISAGHSNASFDVLRLTQGIASMTHFYNAMSPLTHREPGCVGFGLLSDVDVEIIYDRVHVTKEAVEILLRCKTIDKILAVSDGTKLSGTPEGTTAAMWGHQATNSSGSARLQDGTLAGSSSTLVDVFTNLWQDFGPEVAIMACSMNPRRVFGITGEPQMWLLVDEAGAIQQVQG